MLNANAYYHFDHIETYYRDIPDLLDVSKRRFYNLVYHWMREHISEDDWKRERRTDSGAFIGLSYEDVFNMPRHRYERITRMKLTAQAQSEKKRKDGTFNFKGFKGFSEPAKGITKEGKEE